LKSSIIKRTAKTPNIGIYAVHFITASDRLQPVGLAGLSLVASYRQFRHHWEPAPGGKDPCPVSVSIGSIPDSPADDQKQLIRFLLRSNTPEFYHFQNACQLCRSDTFGVL
jgi:hypothetical protein